MLAGAGPSETKREALGKNSGVHLAGEWYGWREGAGWRCVLPRGGAVHFELEPSAGVFFSLPAAGAALLELSATSVWLAQWDAGVLNKLAQEIQP